MQEMQDPLEDDRAADHFEAESIKYNIARIVRLSSGRYALFSHYNEGALNLIQVGTIEEIAPGIPSAEECHPITKPSSSSKAGLDDLLSTLGL